MRSRISDLTLRAWAIVARTRRRIHALSWPVLIKRTLITLVLVVVFCGLAYSRIVGPVTPGQPNRDFIVSPGQSAGVVADALKQEGLVRSSFVARIALRESMGSGDMRPGGYALSGSMDLWTIVKVLAERPHLAFVTFPNSIRKEEMGDILTDALAWTPAQVQEWNTFATAPDTGLAEGVYYPDTYFIPSDQSPTQVASRLRARFTDVVAPLAARAQAKGLSWNQVLTLASIVDREAAKNDRGLVAGVLWNRLHNGMLLQADATLQYIRGTEGNWWPQPTGADKYLESEFNTYKHVGLPPHPINNPTMESIAAVIDPDTTNCIYYLHDNNHVIHCSPTYAGHRKNIDRYLK